MSSSGQTAAADVVALLAERGWRIGIAESLTGGLLVAELVSVPGASAVVSGGVVAYDTELKRTLVGVDGELLAREGPVHPQVAEQLADRIRSVVAIGGAPAEVGLSTTGVAGPGPQDGHEAGTVFLGFAIGESVSSLALSLDGDRETIRRAVVSESLERLRSDLARL